MNLPSPNDRAAWAEHFASASWELLARSLCAGHRLASTNVRRSTQGENVIFLIDDAFVLKVFAPLRDNFQRELAALQFARGRLGLEVPEIVHAGVYEGWSYILMTQLDGVASPQLWRSLAHADRRRIVEQLGASLRELHACDAPRGTPALDRDWNGFVRRQAAGAVERQRACHANPEWLERLPSWLDERLPLLGPPQARQAFLHGDVHAGNLLLVERHGQWEISGLIDFGDSMCGHRDYELVAPGVLMVQGDRELQRAFLGAYGYRESEMDDTLRARLMLLTVLYECSDLRKYALRLSAGAVDLPLDELERAIYTFA